MTKPTWTSEPPEREGLYKHRHNKQSNELRCEVYRDHDGDLRVRFFGSRYSYVVDLYGGEWAGPYEFPEPQEPEPPTVWDVEMIDDVDDETFYWGYHFQDFLTAARNAGHAMIERLNDIRDQGSPEIRKIEGMFTVTITPGPETEEERRAMEGRA